MANPAQSSTGLEAPPVRQANIVRAGAGKVWEALSTREGWEGWFVNRALLDLRPGGFIHLRWKDFGPEKYTGDTRCEVESVDERKCLVYTWKGHKDRPRTRVEFTLEPRGPITLVRVVETGFGSHIQGAMDNSGGWGACLANLKVWVEHGIRFDGKEVAGHAKTVSARRRRVDGGKAASRRR